MTGSHPFAKRPSPHPAYWFRNEPAEVEIHRRMIRERERAYAEFRRLQNDKPREK